MMPCDIIFTICARLRRLEAAFFLLMMRASRVALITQRSRYATLSLKIFMFSSFLRVHIALRHARHFAAA